MLIIPQLKILQECASPKTQVPAHPKSSAEELPAVVTAPVQKEISKTNEVGSL